MAGDLSVAEQQIVEIAKALALDARILVMDEPTAALDKVEAQRLLDLVRKLRERGRGGRLYLAPDVRDFSDRRPRQRDEGWAQGHHRAAADLPTSRLVRLMVGRDLADFYPPRAETPPGRFFWLEIRGGGNRHSRGHQPRGARRRDRRRRRAGGSGKTALARALIRRPTLRARRNDDRRRGSCDSRARARRSRRASAACPTTASARVCRCSNRSRDNVTLTVRAFAPALRRADRRRDVRRNRRDERLRQLDVRAAQLRRGGPAALRRQPAEGDRRAAGWRAIPKS